jgi:hypothetical protein
MDFQTGGIPWKTDSGGWGSGCAFSGTAGTATVTGEVPEDVFNRL